MSKFLIRASCLLALAAAAATPASAIECVGKFQLQPDGSQIATPYCEDGNLARVARQHGIGVSAVTIREHPTVKSQVCQATGEDNRVRATCEPFITDSTQ